MIPKIIKLIASILLLGYGVYQITETFIGNGIFLIILSYTINSTIFLNNEVLNFCISKFKKAESLIATEKILKLIKNPKSALVQKQQGFYYYLHGSNSVSEKFINCRKTFP
jgi:hypothetical protein